MIRSHEELRRRIASRGLPEAVGAIAAQGAAGVHPDLEYSLFSVDLGPDSPTSTILREFGGDDWVPIWMPGSTSTVFSLPDGTFSLWNAEAEECWETWPDFTGVVRSVLQECWEGEVPDEALEGIAALLLPEHERRAALAFERRWAQEQS